MSDYEKICTFRFKRGRNSCDVLVNFETLRADPTGSIRVEWDKWPPSPRDCRIWSRKCFPEVCRKLAELMPGGPLRVLAVNGYGEAIRIDTNELKEKAKCS